MWILPCLIKWLWLSQQPFGLVAHSLPIGGLQTRWRHVVPSLCFSLVSTCEWTVTTERFILERYNKVNIHLFYLPIWIQNRNSYLSCFCCWDILFSVWQYCGLTNYNKLTSDSLIKVKSMSAAMMHHRLHPSIPQPWKCLIFRSLTFVFYYHTFCRTVSLNEVF